MRTSVLLPMQFSFKLESILLISHSRSRRIPSIFNLSSKVFLIHWSLLLLPTWMIAISHNNAFQHLICGLFENVRYTVFPWWFKQSWHALEKMLIYVSHKQLIIKWCDGYSALDDRMVRIYSHSRMLYKWITVESFHFKITFNKTAENIINFKLEISSFGHCTFCRYQSCDFLVHLLSTGSNY